jgi:hypothetical protein
VPDYASPRGVRALPHISQGYEDPTWNRSNFAQDGWLTDQTWIDLARVHFKGQIIVGKDLMEI